jgi:penicillin amidase
MVAVTNFLPDPTSHWFDDKLTPLVEERDEILVLALEDAVEELTQSLGRNISNWTWGDLHVAIFENQALGQSGIGPIEALFNRGPVPVDGSLATVNNTGYGASDPYVVRTVPSYRQIIDLKDFDRSVSMHTTGQSGHPFHRHYKDMIDSWRNFEYHPMLWNRQLVETVAEDHLTLTPGE